MPVCGKPEANRIYWKVYGETGKQARGYITITVSQGKGFLTTFSCTVSQNRNWEGIPLCTGLHWSFTIRARPSRNFTGNNQLHLLVDTHLTTDSIHKTFTAHPEYSLLLLSYRRCGHTARLPFMNRVPSRHSTHTYNLMCHKLVWKPCVKFHLLFGVAGHSRTITVTFDKHPHV